MPGGILSYTDNTIFSKKLINIIESFDYKVATLECALGNGENLWEDKENIVYASNDSLNILEKLQINLVSLANNHIYDLSEKGLKNTINLLEKKGIKHIGAGVNIREAREPVIVNIKNKNFGFLAYCQHKSKYVGKVKVATENEPGVAPLCVDLVLKDINELKYKCNYIFLLIHWGIEYTWFVSPEIQEMAKIFINAGASSIIGSHSHRVQPMYLIDNKPVFFSLGNFIFPNFMMNKPKIIQYPISITNEQILSLPITYNYQEVDNLSLRVWPVLSRIGMIVELSLNQKRITYNSRLTYMKKYDNSIHITSKILSVIYKIYLKIFSIIIRFSFYNTLYYKILRLE